MSSRYERLLWSAEQAKNRNEAQRVLAEEMLMRATEVLTPPVVEDPAGDKELLKGSDLPREGGEH